MKDITRKTKGLVILVNEDGTRLLPGIIEKLRKEGITISTVNLKKPSMDDVFVRYTGKELRDASPERVSTAIMRAGAR